MSLSDSDTGNGDRASTGGTVQPKATHVSEAEARRVAEAARETEWADATFVRDLFLGDFRLDLIHPYPDPDEYIGERTRAKAAFKSTVQPDDFDMLVELSRHALKKSDLLF